MVPEQSCAGTKKRGLASKIIVLQKPLVGLLSTMEKLVTVRQLFYQASVNGYIEKEESGYRKVQRELLRLRRDGAIRYEWVSDNTRWQRKPETYDSLEDCLAETARFYRQSVWRDINQNVEVWCVSIFYPPRHKPRALGVRATVAPDKAIRH